MNANEWNAAFGKLARETMSSPELERYYSVPITKPRAQLLLQQLSLYVRHRRDCWAFVSGNCPVLSVKQKILAHEYEEMIRDQHSEHGHLDLIIRQGKAIGLSAKDILEARPIPSTTATLYGWGWICKKKHWLEGLAAMTMTEWNQDDRLLADLGGGHAARWANFGSSTWVSHGMIFLTGRRIARQIRSTWTCSFPFGKNSAMARTKKLFCKRQRSPKSFIVFIKRVSPTPWRLCRRIIFCRR